MQNFRNNLIALAAVGIFAAVGTLMNSKQAAAQGPPGGMAVNIVNPLPVPVTGSTTVSGSVAATQSGTWSVGISGTPGVNANINANGTIPSVNVANSKASGGNLVPLVTQTVSASSIFNVNGACAITNASGGFSCQTATLLSVQPNSVAVLDSVSGLCYPFTGNGIGQITLVTDKLAPVASILPGPQIGQSVPFSQNLTAYLIPAPSGTNYSIEFVAAQGNSGGICEAHLSGHYLAQ